MKNFQILFHVLLFSTSCFAAPAPTRALNVVARTGAPSANGPPQASGSLRGGDGLIGYNPSNPISDDTTVIPQSEFGLAPGQSEDANLGLYLDLQNVQNPQPIRGGTKAPTDPGPRNYAYDRLNSDLFAPPGTDMGDVPNLKWPMGLSHNRHGSTASAGWARQQNIDELPAAVAMAGVDMRLSPNAYRELHWHKANEWSLMLNGSVRVSAMDEEGRTFYDDLQAGDVWVFPAGIPHSIQALDDGCEFLLVFDEGSFSEDNTFLASELFERNPQAVMAKDLRTDVSSFDDLPDGELYIFPGQPTPADINDAIVTGPAGTIPQSQTFSYHFSQQAPYTVPGGSVKIIDSTSFPASAHGNFAAALVTVDPGAMREVHWHTGSDEWQFYIAGQGRMTVFDAPDASRTFDFAAGDTGYVPYPDAHYIENTGDEPLVYLEMLLQPKFSDISVGQWLGLTTPQVVEDTLHLPKSVIDRLPKSKPYILPGDKNLTQTNFTSEGL